MTKRKQAFRNFCKNPTQENVVEYKRCRAVAKKTMKKEKERAGGPFVTNLVLILQSGKYGPEFIKCLVRL